MQIPLHECAVAGCGRRVPTYLLMCIDHWRMVPAQIQREVTAAWRERLATREAPEGVRRHALAVDQAVAAVATKQNQKFVRRAAVEGDLFADAEPAASQQGKDDIKQDRRRQ